MAVKFKVPNNIAGDDHEHKPSPKLGHLKKAYFDGNVLAAHEAVCVCQEEAVLVPTWASDAMQTHFIKYYSGDVIGKKGKGNSVLGPYLKLVKAHVRAKAFHTVRAWHANPHSYHDMPRRLILQWFNGEVAWSADAVVADALRHAHVGLRQTIFAARMNTIRKAKAMQIPHSITFGDMQAEVLLGLRNDKGIFGASDVAVPDDIDKFLKGFEPPSA